MQDMRRLIIDGLVAGVGGFVGIGCTAWLSRLAVGDGVPVLALSMGATAVLLFALPRSPVAQPWAVVGGHGLASVMGVVCAQWLGVGDVAAAAAVGGAIVAMVWARCIHPPGGGTALAAVLGGEAVRALGYGYVVLVLLNALWLLAIAMVWHAPFTHRRYPWRGG